jgi:putative ABC transport system permease protein
MLETIIGTILGILEEGFVYAILALGVYITYKILDFPDLSVDGTFPLGGAITAVLIKAGMNPLIALPISFLAGALAGMLTGIIHVKFRVRDLLSGIIMMTALYSVNLRIAGANLPIFSKDTIFENSFLKKVVPEGFQPFLTASILFLIVLIMKLLLDMYLRTKSGYLLRAVGDNDAIVTSLAKDKGTVKIIGLSIANAFVSLAGSVQCQNNGVFEISNGTGSMVFGLASVIIGMNLMKKVTFIKVTTAVILGSIIYKACVYIAISFGFIPQDMKLVTSVLFLGILIISNDRRRKVKANA